MPRPDPIAHAAPASPLIQRRAPHLRQAPLWLAALALCACSSNPASRAGAVNTAEQGAVGTRASAQTAATAALAASGAASGSATSAAASNAGLTPFDQVIKGAEHQSGLLKLWRKGDKTWIELRPGLMGKPLFLSPKLSTGIGEAGVFGGLMQSRFAQVGRPQWVEFRRVNQQVQLLAVNSAFEADAQSPQALAVKAAFSPSLLASVPLASAPHPATGGVLIDASALLLGDWLGLAPHLQRSYRQSYALDPRNSVVQTARTQDQLSVFEVVQHYATGTIAAPGGNPPGTPSASVPINQPDPRSLFVTLHLSFTPLPAQPMPRRTADPRVGYFTSTVTDFTQDLTRTPRMRFINRWRLEKKQPDAAVSEPVQPIVFWLDPSIPTAYRETVSQGVLAWNQAFEAIGFKGAIEVRTPPTDKPFDTLETGHSSIRWMTNSQPGFGAIGPSHVDPRSGEILDAHIALESLSSRAIRTARSQILNGGASSSSEADTQAPPSLSEHCEHSAQAFEQLNLGLSWLESQEAITGQGLDPDAPEVRAFVLAYLKDTTMHEVGHALGLRHNFRASHWRSPTELQDLALTTALGNSASVMDYSAINLPAPGQPGGAPFQTTLGPYDLWAVAYGYTPLPAEPKAANQALQDIAAKAGLPDQADALAFGTDEDAGLDPEVLPFDLGRDPVAFARTRIAIVKDLLAREAKRPAGPLADPSLPRRTVMYGLRELARTSQILLKQVGGVVARRAAAYQGTDALRPLPAAAQRAALEELLRTFVNPEALTMPATLQRRLAPDYQERADNGDGNFGSTDFSWAEQLLALQRPVLDLLVSDNLAERLQDNIDKTRDSEPQPLTVKELNKRLFDTIWDTHVTQDALAPAWRSLQRDHVNRVAVAVVRSASGRADVRSLMRQQAQRLLSHLREHKFGGPDSTAEAHRQDCIQTLTAALQASVVRNTP
jgi:hypothetical protein